MRLPPVVRLLAATLVAGAVALVPSHARASSLESEIELLRSDLKTGKLEVVKDVLHVEGTRADAFWPLYRKYQLELDKIGDQRLALIKDYAAHYDNMTDEKAKTLVKQSLDLASQRTDLLKKYYKDFEKVLGSTDAARLIQVEHLIMALVDVQLGAEIPLIEHTAGKPE